MHTALYEFFRDQGSIIAGLLALIAGVLAYRAGLLQARATRTAAEMQTAVEEQKSKQEVSTVRKSLAIEVRQLVVRALTVHKLLKKLAAKTDGPITDRMVESYSRVPAPVVYPAAADKIGLLDGEAMDVVIVYFLIEVGRVGVNQLMRDRTPDDIRPTTVAMVAEAFLRACEYARGVLPRLRTGEPHHDKKDDELIEQITNAIAEWESMWGNRKSVSQ